MALLLRASSLSAIFLATVILIALGIGFRSSHDTEFTIGSPSEAARSRETDGNTRALVMWSTNFPPLAGILNVGYYTHTVAIPIVRQNN